MDKKNNSFIIKIIVILVCLIGGYTLPKFIQPKTKTINIYIQAVETYNKQDYQNAYYLFSKIGNFSTLKSAALYRQAMCAKELNDKQSELKAYQKLFYKFPRNVLSSEAKYYAGVILRDSEPRTALKYFKSVINSSSAKKEYKIAAMYNYARILVNLKQISDPKIDKYFAKYLKEYPDGKFALENARIFEKYKHNNLTSYDFTLITRVYYANKLYDDAQKLFPQTSLQDSWAIQASNNYMLNDYSKTQFLTELGVANYSDTVDFADYKNAVSDYLKTHNNDKYSAISRLYKVAKGKGKDYILYLKCENTAIIDDRYSCYSDLTKTYPKSEYTKTVLENQFYDFLNAKNYKTAYYIGLAFLKTFENPKITFWMAKVCEKLGKISESNTFYQDVIKKYPDTYYAYRAAILSNGYEDSLFPKNELKFKPIEYPYKKDNFIKSLLLVHDYEMIAKIKDDEFVNSWAQYMKGNLSTSMHIAKIAMDKIKVKPAKNDLRWRLVYPLNYYDDIVKYSHKYGNNTALIYGIVREESYFNKNAGSSVGAMGLMQLMPSTAIETANKSGFTNFSLTDLYIPQTNLILGNIYYSQLRGLLSDKNISAVASYNGGIGSVYNWKRTLNYSDIDDFVEQIPFPETKEYVKKVFRTYWNYYRIYN